MQRHILTYVVSWLVTKGAREIEKVNAEWSCAAVLVGTEEGNMYEKNI